MLGVVLVAATEVTETSLASASTLSATEIAVLGAQAAALGPATGTGTRTMSEITTLLPVEPVDANSSADQIAALQLRLRWVGSLAEQPSGVWNDATVEAIKHFQRKHNRGKASGVADEKTVKELAALAGNGALDPRCLTNGIVLCLDKDQKMIRYVKAGQVIREFDMNIGPEKGDPKFGAYSSTRLGSFRIGNKQVSSVSSLYGYVMPYWMQFDKGIGFHYSEYFKKSGYKDSSMGCTITNNKADAKWLYDNSPLKTRVIVY